jgi:DNA-binding LytR/AlgR family response regulator
MFRSGKMLKILLGDDDLDLVEMYRFAISGIMGEFGLFSQEWKIVEVNTLEESLVAAQTGRWDLAFIDGNFRSWDKSGDDGYQITNALSKSLYPVYIVGISADEYQDKQFWQQNGVFLKKPVGYKEIKAALLPLFTMT